MNTPDLDVVDILLIDDDPGDIHFTREAFDAHRVINKLFVVSDGVQALQFLRQEGNYTNARRPGLVLLDLNLPRKDGRELLAEMQTDRSLSTIPVVILTASDADEAILRGKRLPATGYVRKPVDLTQLVAAIRHTDRLLLTVVRGSVKDAPRR